MAHLKRIFVVMAVFSLLGVAAATAVIPSLMGWYNAPAAGGAMCNCQELVHHTATTVIEAQALGLLMGAAAGLLVALALVRRTKRMEAAAAVTLPKPALPQ